MMGSYFGGFGHTFMPMIGLIIFIIVIYLLFSGRIGSCHMGHHRDHNNTTNQALEELKSRYVKGEITKKEFEVMKKDIA